jgi:outer membrane protein assembly factor BamB
MPDTTKTRPIRWRSAVAIALLALVALAVIWLKENSRQEHVLQTMITGLIATALLFLWATLFSRFATRTRLLIFFLGALIGFTLSRTVRISGVTGDLVPILSWKWSKPRIPALANAPTNKNSANPQPTSQASFPQFLGPNRNGIIPNIHLDTNWTSHPPTELWRHPVGPGWTGFVIANQIAVTQEQRGEDESVTAYDLATGNPVWTHSDAAHYNTTIAGEGPRATPTISSNKVYTLGSTGILDCLDLATGRVIWTKNILQENSAHVPEWGLAGAPLVYDQIVIVCAGGHDGRSLVAYNKDNGAFVWGGGNESAGYSSPTVMELAGVKQAIIFNHHQVAGHDLADGKLLWAHPWPTGTPHCAMPIQISPNRLMASQGYGYGSELIEVAQTNGVWSAERVWKSNRLKSKFANLILYKGLVYGLDDGIFVCFDPVAGERKWQGDRHGHGQMLLVGDIILMMAENGEVLLIEPSPDQEKVVARFRAFTSKTWNPPALAGESLLIRNDSEAACYKLPLASYGAALPR